MKASLPWQDWIATLPAQYDSCPKLKYSMSMTRWEEHCFCEAYMRDCFTGAGRIVDLGCWFGATTYFLARGLAQNPQATQNRIIDAFDLFIWEKWMEQPMGNLKLPIVHCPGESFLPDVQKLLAPFHDLVRLHQQDLMKHQPAPEPIEMLFIDAMKTWQLAQTIVASFFPRLIPGLSVVVQQDFVSHAPIVATNHLIMWRLRDHFEWIHHVPSSGSVAFVSKKRIDPEMLVDLSAESFSLDDIEQAYEYSLACVPEDEARRPIKVAKLLFLVQRGYDDAALTEAEELAASGIRLPAHIVTDISQVTEARRNQLVLGAAVLTDEAHRDEKLASLGKMESLLRPSAAKHSVSLLARINRRWSALRKSGSFPRLLALLRNKHSR